MRIRLFLAALFVVLFILTPTLARWYTDWLWFGEVGQLQLFWIPLISRVGVTVGLGGVLLLLLVSNLRPVLRRLQTRDVIDLDADGRSRRTYRRTIRLPRPSGLIVVSLAAVSLVAGLAASGQWTLFQQFVHAQSFGVSDPLFKRDIGFFVFQLPLYHFAESWLFGWLVLIFLVVTAGYYLTYSSLMLRGLWAVPAHVRGHLSLLAGLILLVRGWGFWLDAFALEYSPRGAIFGATYTDVHASLPVLRLLTALFVICAILMFGNVRLRAIRLAIGPLVVIVIAWGLGLGVYPRLVQQIRVAPSELTLETPYIQHGIAGTLAAFGLDRVREQEFSTTAMTPEILERNRVTLENVRVWDHRPLLSAYRQLQGLRSYYSFADVDIDRYRVQGVERQVMLAARELEIVRLSAEARTWVNEHLVFTHGYGLVMSPVNRFSEEGMPEFFIKDVPPVTVDEFRIIQPQIYFGERTDRYVIVNTRVQELDYPKGNENAYTAYGGRGGILLSPLRRLAFAYRFGDPRLLFSSDLTNESRMLFAREITTRVRRIAPFLTYDRDPYLVLVDGRLVWILDAYTTSDRYPYSTPTAGINYIRNAVKVVIDAYEGTVDFYLVDPTDPVARVLAGIFPQLFKPAAAIPAALAAHLRYPLDLFQIQARVYATFHMRDPRVFYNREDAWAIPMELFANEPVLVEPYYVTLRVGEEAQPEFVLILPFTPSNRDNMVAWMAARNDAPHYGELLVYRFPKDRIVFGPMQVESRISQDPGISQQLTLWNQQGSQVVRGNLLVIPMENALLYVEPLFLQAERSQLPELKRVIVASGSRIVIDETLDAAVAKLVGKVAAPVASALQPTTGTVRELVARAVEIYQRAQRLLRQGDLVGYAREIDRLGEVLQQLQRAQERQP